MAGSNDKLNSKNNNHNDGKPKKRKYLLHNKPVRKGSYPLRPGVQGFFITCDGGRERQAIVEALNLVDVFYEELVDGKSSVAEHKAIPIKPLNKKIKFRETDSSDGENVVHPGKDSETDKVENESGYSEEVENEEESADMPVKKQRVETAKGVTEESNNAKDKSIDELIEDELREMGNRNKRIFLSLESGCNGCVFIQMQKSAGDLGPTKIVQHMMTSAASTRKHMSRFILRVIPVEVTCYASEDEISKAVQPLIEQHFPAEAAPQKFAVLYEARANTGIDRMKIINSVAKSVPQPHKVDLSNPEKTIIVQIAKTICMVGVVERYKELSKYNLRQLTAQQ